jgi:beta-galactosidase
VCTQEDITLAMHPVELPRRGFNTLNLDHRQSGVGGTNSWGQLPLPQYRLPANKAYQWSFMLSFTDSPAVSLTQPSPFSGNVPRRAVPPRPLPPGLQPAPPAPRPASPAPKEAPTPRPPQ